MKYLIKDEKGLLSIEAGLVFILFFMGYIFINSLVLSSYTESNTQKAITSLALDLSNYSIILEKASLTSYFEKGEDTSIFDDLSEFSDEQLSKEKIDSASIYNDLKDLCSKKLSDRGKAFVYNKTFRKLIKNYFKNEDYLLDKKIEGGYEGLDFSKSRILDEGDFEIILNYTINNTFMNLFKSDRKIIQKAMVSTNIELKSINSDDDSTSIWDEDNFTRGRYFADYIRKNTNSYQLKLGQGIDLYSQEDNKLSQFHSINIFNKSYSEKVGEDYEIDTDNLQKEVKEKMDLMNENIDKLDGTLTLSDGQIRKFPKDINKELLLVMPKEAEEYQQIHQIAKNLSSEDMTIKILFLEEAL